MKAAIIVSISIVIWGFALGCESSKPSQKKDELSRITYSAPQAVKPIAPVHDETGDNFFFTPHPHCTLGEFTFSVGRIWWSTRIDRSLIAESSDDLDYQHGDATGDDHLLVTIQVEYSGPEPANLPRITLIDSTPNISKKLLGEPADEEHEIEPEQIGYLARDGAFSVQRVSYGPAKVFVLPFAAMTMHKAFSLKFSDGHASSILHLDVPEYHLDRHRRAYVD